MKKELDMFDSTVNELAKYTMQDHKGNVTQLVAEDLVAKQKEFFHQDQHILQAAKVLVKEKKTGLPVINSAGELVGFLSEKDCMRHMFDDFMNNAPIGTVKDYMTKDLIVLYPQSTIYQIVEHFLAYNVQSFPVCDKGNYIGLIRRKDILEALMELDRYKA